MHDKRVLEYCYPTARKAADIAAYLGVSDSTYFRKHVLDNLAAHDYLLTETVGNARYYRTNRENVERE